MQDCGAEGGDGCEADTVGRDHQLFAGPAVGGEPGRQGRQHLSRGTDEGHDAGICRRVGEGQDEQRVGDRRGLSPGVGEELSRLQQHEVSVAAQRRGLHALSVMRAEWWNLGPDAACVEVLARSRQEIGRQPRTLGQGTDVGGADLID